jgi:hypothetical protein
LHLLSEHFYMQFAQLVNRLSLKLDPFESCSLYQLLIADLLPVNNQYTFDIMCNFKCIPVPYINNCLLIIIHVIHQEIIFFLHFILLTRPIGITFIGSLPIPIKTLLEITVCISNFYFYKRCVSPVKRDLVHSNGLVNP